MSELLLAAMNLDLHLDYSANHCNDSYPLPKESFSELLSQVHDVDQSPLPPQQSHRPFLSCFLALKKPRPLFDPSSTSLGFICTVWMWTSPKIYTIQSYASQDGLRSATIGTRTRVYAWRFWGCRICLRQSHFVWLNGCAIPTKASTR